MALTISQLINDYGSYSGNTLVGIRGARATVPSSGWGGVTGVPYDNITFIVKVNGTRYASSRWLSQQKNGNPYIHKSSVPRIDFQDIPNAEIDTIKDITGTTKDRGDGRKPMTLKQGETFAEVDATSKLTSDDAILSFINDLLSANPDVEPWNKYGSYEPKIGVPVPVPGTITSPTGKTYSVGVTTPFGGTYNPELDMAAEYPGMEFDTKPVSLLGLTGEEAAAVAIPPTSAVADVTEDGGDVDVVDIAKEVEDLMRDRQIEPIELNPLDFDFGFGFGDINMDQMNLTMGNLNPVSSGFGNNNMTGLASLQDLVNEGGLERTGLGSYNTDYSGSPIGALYSD